MELLSGKEVYSEVVIQSAQDGLFFGLDYLENSLDIEKAPKAKAYFSDGDCVFKGQTLLSIETENTKTKDLLAIISYLSGAYTLISCFTEKNFDFSICAGLSPHFELSHWEEQAILKAGAVLRPLPKEFLSLEPIQKQLKQSRQSILLSESKISRADMKTLLKNENSSSSFELHGAFLPSDLEEFRECQNIKAVYPICLQGHFPKLEMKLIEQDF